MISNVQYYFLHYPILQTFLEEPQYHLCKIHILQFFITKFCDKNRCTKSIKIILLNLLWAKNYVLQAKDTYSSMSHSYRHIHDGYSILDVTQIYHDDLLI